MNLEKDYNKETGLHSRYYARSGSHAKAKKGLIYTRKYVWWLENKLKAMDENLTNLIERLSKKGEKTNV